MIKLTDRIPDYKAARQLHKELVHRAMMPLLFALLIYKTVSAVIVLPLIHLIWAGALRLSPVHYITNNNLFSVLKIPFVPAALVFIALIGAFWALFEYSLIIHGLDSALKQERIKTSALLKLSFTDIKHAVRLRNLPVLVYAAVLIPFTDFFMTSDYISQLVVPEYIMEVIRKNPFYFVPYIVLFCVCLIATILLFSVLQIFMLEDEDFAEAAGTSIKAAKKRFIPLVLTLILRNIAVFIRYFIITSVCFALIFLGIFAAGLNNAELARCLGNAFTVIQLPVFMYILNCMTTVEQTAIISAAYYTYNNKTTAHKAEEAAAEAFKDTDIFNKKYTIADFIGSCINHLRGGNSDLKVSEEAEKIKLKALKKAKKQDRRFRIGSRIFAPLVMLAVTCITGAFAYIMFRVPETSELFAPRRAAVSCHRGYSKVAPENTLPAFQAAIDINADYAELDVQLTKDGVVVVSHDPTLKRTAGVNKAVCDLSYAEVSGLDAGSYFSKEFAGTKIPTLEEVLKLCKGKIKLNIEIKHNDKSPELEAETVKLIKENGFEKDCVITSLSYESLSRVKELDPDIRTGYILAVGAGNYYDLPAADFFSVEISFITKGMVNAVHQRGKTISAWTVNRESDAQQLKSLGVDDMITEDPVMVREIIGSSAALGDSIYNFINDLNNNIGTVENGINDMRQNSVPGYDDTNADEVLEGA